MAKNFKLLQAGMSVEARERSEAKANVLLSMFDLSLKPKRLPHWWDEGCTSDPNVFNIEWQLTVPSLMVPLQEEIRHSAFGPICIWCNRPDHQPSHDRGRSVPIEYFSPVITKVASGADPYVVVWR